MTTDLLVPVNIRSAINPTGAGESVPAPRRCAAGYKTCSASGSKTVAAAEQRPSTGYTTKRETTT
jgi:hypothetical protein